MSVVSNKLHAEEERKVDQTKIYQLEKRIENERFIYFQNIQWILVGSFYQ